MVMLLKYGGVRGSHDFNLDIDVSKLPSRREALEEISKPAAGIHGLAKHIPPQTVAQVLDNEPFEDFPRAVYGYKRACGEGGEAKDKFTQSFRKAIESFLRRVYYSLTSIPGISFDIENVDEKEERKALDKAIASYEASDLGGQVSSVEEAYDGLRALRTVFGSAGQRNSFSVETVIPSRYLPELLMAAPVWFLHCKQIPGGDSETEGVRYFCNLGATDQCAYLFQMYNRWPHSFDKFAGRDVMPLPIMELVSKVRNLFDFLVIATPYHDLASNEWRDPQWIRNIDPYLVGFLKQVPELMFFLGRWSGTGLFPLVGDMIADTIEHIRKNKMLLGNIREKANWYRVSPNTAQREIDIGPRLRPVDEYPPIPNDVNGTVEERDKLYDEDHTVVKCANTLLKHFQQSDLFSWLRGEA